MITVNLYKNFSKRDNSTLQPGSGVSYDTFSCSLKDRCSVTAPVLDLRLSSDPASEGYNYAYIPSLSRYYYIYDWTYVQGYYEASLAVDVLASYKSDIGDLQPYVIRAASVTEDDSIPDNFYPATNSWAVREINIPYYSLSNRDYVIGILSSPTANSNNTLGSVRYYRIGETNLVHFIQYLMGSFISNYIVDAAAGLTESVAKSLVDPLQYIVSLTLFPMQVIYSETAQPIKPMLGPYDTTNDGNVPYMYELEDFIQGQSYNVIREVSIPTNPYAATAGKAFLAYPPYVQYDLILEPFGTIPLDASLLAGHSKLYLGTDVDLVSGLARLSIGTQSGDCELGTYTAQLGVPVALAQITEDVIGSAGSVLGGIAGGIGAALSGNIIGAVGAAFQGAADATRSIAPQAQKLGTNGALLSYGGVNNAKLIMRYCDCMDVNINEWGLACYKTVTNIRALSGYVKCAEADYDLPALRSERIEINNYLRGGFFYE